MPISPSPPMFVRQGQRPHTRCHGAACRIPRRPSSMTRDEESVEAARRLDEAAEVRRRCGRRSANDGATALPAMATMKRKFCAPRKAPCSRPNIGTAEIARLSHHHRSAHRPYRTDLLGRRDLFEPRGPAFPLELAPGPIRFVRKTARLTKS